MSRPRTVVAFLAVWLGTAYLVSLMAGDAPASVPWTAGLIVAVGLYRFGRRTPDFDADLRRRIHYAAAAVTGAPTDPADPGSAPFRWVQLQRDGDDVTDVRVWYPAAFRDGDSTRRDALERAVAAKLGGSWAATWDCPANVVSLRPTPPLPEHADYLQWDLPAGQLAVGFTDPGDGPDTEDGRTLAVWDVTRTPHALLSGATGSGKTAALRALVAAWLWQGGSLLACDPKRVELAFLRGRVGVEAVASDLDGMRTVVHQARAEMDARYEAWEQDRTRTGVPLLLVVDEATQLIAMSRAEHGKNRDPLLDDLAAIARLGRMARVHLLLGMQRPDADDLPGELKRNLDLRLAVGPHDEIASRMVLGTDDATDVAPVKGRGVLRAEGRSRRVQVMWLADPYDPDATADQRDAAEAALPPIATEPAAVTTSAPVSLAAAPAYHDPHQTANGAYTPSNNGDGPAGIQPPTRRRHG